MSDQYSLDQTRATAPESDLQQLRDNTGDARAAQGSQRAQADDIRSAMSPVQRAGGGEGNGAVHAAASRGIAGAGGALPHLDAIQRSFGRHDVSGVRAHVGGRASEANASMGAEAYATGNDVAFARSPDLHTAAHEAAHVVQQRGGVSLKGGVGAAGDAYEQHADAVADRVVQGQSAEALLDSMAGGASSVQRRVVQRFESNEHTAMGDEGSKNAQGQAATVELAPKYFVSFGELTSMSGDFFASADQIKTLAQNDGKGPGTREEVEYVRKCLLPSDGSKAKETAFREDTRAAVKQRYLALAGDNSSHFTEPNDKDEVSKANNKGNYRDNHEQALRLAARAGKAGTPIDEALLCEGFASHFLTDAYAAGHVRTERISISGWWNPKIPMFWTNLKLYIAEKLAHHVNDNTTWTGMLTVQVIWEQARKTLENMGLPELTFGDLVSGAVHDYDNHTGVDTQHGRLVGDGMVLDEHGKPQQGGKHTAQLAVKAVGISIGEVRKAYADGKTVDEAAILAAAKDAQGLYAAEIIWPKARPDAQQAPDSKSTPWKADDLEGLVADSQMAEALKLFAREKASTLEAEVTLTDEVQKQGFQKHVVEPLKDDTINLLRRVVNYTPNTGGGVGGHDTDDNAMEYLGMVKAQGDKTKVAGPDGKEQPLGAQGALATLTESQKVALIRNLIAGACGDSEEQAINEMLQTSPVSQMQSIVETLGGGDAKKGVDYLDSGIDGAEWRACKAILGRSAALKKVL